MYEIVTYSFIVMLASLVGVFLVWGGARRVMERNIDFLISFSAGVFSIIAYRLGVEAVESAETLGYGLGWIIAGTISVWILFKILPHFHHHEEGVGAIPHTSLDARKVIFGDALHNVGDGILMASAFAVSSSLGVLTTLSIFIHELVQEISEFFVLKGAGFTTKKALLLNFLVSGTLLIGSLGAFFLLGKFQALEVPILGVTSGAFLVVVLHDLIPHSVKISRRENVYIKHIMAFVIGAFIIYSMNYFIGH